MKTTALLPIPIIEQIASHADFFTGLYMGFQPCICEWWDEPKSQEQLHVRRLVNRLKGQKTLQQNLHGTWSSKCKAFFGIDQYVPLYQLLWQLTFILKSIEPYLRLHRRPVEAYSLTVWDMSIKQIKDALLRHRISQTNVEGVPLVWVYYYTETQRDTSHRKRKPHWHCLSRMLQDLLYFLHGQKLEDFQLKKDF